MYLREIEYFIAIAEEGSLSKASNTLFVSQPSLSHFLIKLESELDVKLFNRKKNNSFELTQAGQTYLEGCKNIANIWKELQGRLQDDKAVADMRFSFGVTDERFCKVLADCLPVFNQIHPDVSIEILQFSVDQLIQKVIAGQLDIAHSAFDTKEELLRYVPLTVVEVDLVVPQQHPLAAFSYRTHNPIDKRISLHEIRENPVVLLKSNTILRQLENQYFKKIDFYPNIKVEAYTSYSTLSIVESGSYLGLCPRSFQSDKVAYIALDPPLYYTSGLYYRKDAFLSKAMKDLIRTICEKVDKKE
ncbi:HTH-type transcriptional regulator CynR [bioreactor metagenome]|uniref:HTH-type transcriptional regulator CynR n=1 Tax=bioreactor metagenome TaxID=1076179 RepID=A0A645CB31_9ZZZZ